MENLQGLADMVVLGSIPKAAFISSILFSIWDCQHLGR